VATPRESGKTPQPQPPTAENIARQLFLEVALRFAEATRLHQHACAQRSGRYLPAERAIVVSHDEGGNERQGFVEQRRARAYLRIVGDHKSVQHVELDRVHAAGSRRLDRSEAVLRRERRRAPVADADDSACAPEQLHQLRRWITTTARSSESSPPA